MLAFPTLVDVLLKTNQDGSSLEEIVRSFDVLKLDAYIERIDAH